MELKQRVKVKVSKHFTGVFLLLMTQGSFVYAPPRTQLTRAEALKILGFSETASPTLQDVLERYRQRMQSAHPDRGGSAEEAASLNNAREALRSAPPTSPQAPPRADQPKPKETLLSTSEAMLEKYNGFIDAGLSRDEALYAVFQRSAPGVFRDGMSIGWTVTWGPHEVLGAKAFMLFLDRVRDMADSKPDVAKVYETITHLSPISWDKELNDTARRTTAPYWRYLKEHVAKADPKLQARVYGGWLEQLDDKGVTAEDQQLFAKWREQMGAAGDSQFPFSPLEKGRLSSKYFRALALEQDPEAILRGLENARLAIVQNSLLTFGEKNGLKAELDTLAAQILSQRIDKFGYVAQNSFGRRFLAGFSSEANCRAHFINLVVRLRGQ